MNLTQNIFFSRDSVFEKGSQNFSSVILQSYVYQITLPRSCMGVRHHSIRLVLQLLDNLYSSYPSVQVLPLSNLSAHRLILQLTFQLAVILFHSTSLVISHPTNQPMLQLFIIITDNPVVMRQQPRLFQPILQFCVNSTGFSNQSCSYSLKALPVQQVCINSSLHSSPVYSFLVSSSSLSYHHVTLIYSLAMGTLSLTPFKAITSYMNLV